MNRTSRLISRTALILMVALSGAFYGVSARPAYAAPGDLVGSVTFSVDCATGIGVGIAFDGTNLWYSCYASTTDLYKADPVTGVVSASYNVLGGLGALAWDNGRGKLWAGSGCAPGQTGAEIYLIDPTTGVATLQFNIPAFDGFCLDDGLAYDGLNDTVYHSWDGAVTIRHLSAIGVPEADDGFAWGGSDCYNSGLAVGGSLLYEGSDGCSHVWVVDKVTKAASFDFSTVVPGDPNFRDEDLECDNLTFASIGKEVMWSKEAYSPMRAHAFETPPGSCVFGGGGVLEGRMTGGGSVFATDGVRVTHGFELHCDPSVEPNRLQVNWGGNRFHLQSLTSASCSDDPDIDEGHPVAGFDTYVGEGTGRYNGVPGATATWTFTDAGEPGANDFAEIVITDADGNTVLSVSGNLDRGNHQAHEE